MFLNVPSHKLQCSTYRNFSWNAKIFPDMHIVNFPEILHFFRAYRNFSVQHTKILP